MLKKSVLAMSACEQGYRASHAGSVQRSSLDLVTSTDMSDLVTIWARAAYACNDMEVFFKR